MSDKNDPLAALENDESSKAIAQAVEAAAASGIAAMNNGVPRSTANHVATMAVLASLGGNKARLEDSITFEGTKFVVPEQFRGDVHGAIGMLKAYGKAQRTKTDIVRTFDYRPHDVAHALNLTLREVFGFTGSGKVIQTPFGPIEPELIDVKTGIGQSVQVPYQRLDFPPLHGHIDIGHQRTPKGFLGRISVNAPRAVRDEVEGLFQAIEINLKERSIYRGKALVMDSNDQIDFLDLSGIRREDVVYSPEVMTALESNLWLVVRNMEAFRQARQPIKRTVLLKGPFGTGKSLAAFLTALECVANGTTFIFVKPGADLNTAMAMTQLYAPAVVFFEDVDVLQSNDPQRVSELLDTFDGLSSKNKEIIVVLTTNHEDRIHRGMLRPGRTDTVIHIGEPDRVGVQRIIEVKLKETGIPFEVDFDEVYLACKDFMPAFVGEVAYSAWRGAWTRTGVQPTVITTEDLVTAAAHLRLQHDLMMQSDEIKPITPFQDSLREELREVVRQIKPMDGDGDPSWYVRAFEIDK